MQFTFKKLDFMKARLTDILFLEICKIFDFDLGHQNQQSSQSHSICKNYPKGSNLSKAPKSIKIVH